MEIVGAILVLMVVLLLVGDWVGQELRELWNKRVRK